MSRRITVYRYRNGKGYRFSTRYGKDASVAGDFIFVSHPDEMPEGEWWYYPAREMYAGKQPGYQWINSHRPV